MAFVLKSLEPLLAEIMGELKRITKTGGKIILSGILEGKEEVVINAVKLNGLKQLEEMKQKEWLAYVVQKED